MKRKHRKTLEAIFNKPTPANIPWRDIEALFVDLGAEITEGSGSRIWVWLNGVKAVFHRPHNRKEAGQGLVRAVRTFLENAGVAP